jgi:hypothetical protein
MYTHTLLQDLKFNTPPLQYKHVLMFPPRKRKVEKRKSSSFIVKKPGKHYTVNSRLMSVLRHVVMDSLR